MKNKSILFLILLAILTGCKQSGGSNSNAGENLQNMDSVNILSTRNLKSTVVKLQSPQNADIKASQLIGESKYVFLETTPESLVGLYRNIVIYKDKIYILDDIIAHNIFIFDISGKFIMKIPIGQGPGECVKVDGMVVDKYHDQLVVYDAGKRQFVYYSLDGKPLNKEVDVQFYFTGAYAVMKSGYIVYYTDRSFYNSSLKDVDLYRLVYTDSLGVIKNIAFEYDDNKEIDTAFSKFDNGGNSVLYYPKYQNNIYSVTDDGVDLKYSLDLSNFSPSNIQHIQSLHSYPELQEYLKGKTSLSGNFAETDRFLYFAIEDKTNYIYSFYDINTNKALSFYNLTFDTDFIVDFPCVFSDGNSFIGSASPQRLKDLSVYRKKENRPLNKELDEKIAKLQDDDNAPIVIFTLK